MTLTTIGFDKDPKSVSEIGSMLFKRGVSGARVVTGKETKVIEGHTFKGSSFRFKQSDHDGNLRLQITSRKLESVQRLF